MLKITSVVLLAPILALLTSPRVFDEATPTASPVADHSLCVDRIAEAEIVISLRATDPIDAEDAEEITRVLRSRVRAIMRGPCDVEVSQSGNITVALSPSEYVWLRDSNEPTPLELASLISQVGLVEVIDPQGRDLEQGTVVATTISAPISGTRIGGAPVFETLASNPNVVQADGTRAEFGAYDLSIRFDKATSERLGAYSHRHVGDSVGIVVDHEIFKTMLISRPIGEEFVVIGLTVQELNELEAYVSTLPLPVPLDIVEVTKSG